MKNKKSQPGAEVPGDTGAPDIVGPTGEEMPRQPHDEVVDDDRSGGNTSGPDAPIVDTGFPLSPEPGRTRPGGSARR